MPTFIAVSLGPEPRPLVVVRLRKRDASELFSRGPGDEALDVEQGSRSGGLRRIGRRRLGLGELLEEARDPNVERLALCGRAEGPDEPLPDVSDPGLSGAG